MKNRWSLVAILAILVALGCSIYLANRHYDVMYGLSQGTSFCNVSEKFSCDVVNTSSYSEHFGIPIAVSGAVALFIMLLLALAVRVLDEPEVEVPRRYLFYLSIISGVQAVWYVSIQLFILHTFCLICLTTELMLFILLLASWKLTGPGRFCHIAEDLRDLVTFRQKGTLTMLVAIPILSLLAHGILKNNVTSALGQDIDRYIDQYLVDWKSSPQRDIDISDAILKGNPSAPVTIVEFADFQCPGCKAASGTLHTFVQSYSNKVKMYFQNYPLNSACNSKIKSAMHPLACDLAFAAVCSGQQNKFWEAHDWLFEHQQGISISKLNEMSAEIGIDHGKLTECMKDPKTASIIRAQSDRGNAAEIPGTPAIFVNGKLLPGGAFMPVLKRAVDSL
jgi:protein-disulfide isomerase/uncharacterized membrane protein